MKTRRMSNRWISLLVAALLLALGPMGAAWAQVKVTAADPASTTQGTEGLEVAVSGSGFDSTATVRFLVAGTADNSGGITVDKVVFVGPKKLIATIKAAKDAAIGQFDIEVTLDSGRKGKGTTLFSVRAKAVDPCIGATAAFVFGKPQTPSSPNRTLFLSNASATCQRPLYTTTYGPRYWSFRIVDDGAGSPQGRVVTTDGINELLLIRFPIGPDMAVEPASIVVQRIFDPAQNGYVDATSFELAANGRRLAYVTLDENGDATLDTHLFRLRVVDDIDSCISQPGGAGCLYAAGTLLAERVGNSYSLSSPRWSPDGAWIYLEDRRGDFYRPFISRVSPTMPLQPGHDPVIVYGGERLSLFELRVRGSDEIMLVGDNDGTGCRDLRVLKTATCSAGVCPDRVNALAPAVLVAWGATVESMDSSQMTMLVEGATEDRRGRCSSTGNINRVVDSSLAGVQVTTIVTGADSPAAK